jgi:hypothetical protein
VPQVDLLLLDLPLQVVDGLPQDILFRLMLPLYFVEHVLQLMHFLLALVKDLFVFLVLVLETL